MAHHSDVGGIAPGSVAVHATEIYQEGLRMPLLKLYEAGEPNATLFAIIEKNTRQPVAGARRPARPGRGLRRRRARAARARRDATARRRAQRYIDELQDLAERLMRAEIARSRTASTRFDDYIDGVGDDAGADAHQVTRHGRRRRDRTSTSPGTSPQVPAAINCPVALVNAALLLRDPLHRRARDPELRGLHAARSASRAPGGTIVNPVLPAACGARGVIGYRVFDAIMGALAAGRARSG